MAMSFDVTLPADRVACFPNECPGCGREDPDRHLTVARRAFSWLSVFSPLLWWIPPKAKVRIPMCGPCVREAKWYRWTSLAMVGATIAVAVFLVVPWMQAMEWTRGQRRLALLGVVCCCLFPQMLWEAIRPPIFDLTLSKKKQTVDYEFRRRAYAQAFAERNVGD